MRNALVDCYNNIVVLNFNKLGQCSSFFWRRRTLAVLLQVSWNPSYKKLIRTALALVFLNEKFSSGVL